MNKPIQVTATLPAWLPAHERMDDVLLLVKQGKLADALSRLHYSTSEMDKCRDPWLRCGEADIKLTLFAQNELVAEQLRLLNQELQRIRVESQLAQQVILERISKLQAITYEEPEVAA